jgi:hypothetical protein
MTTTNSAYSFETRDTVEVAHAPNSVALTVTGVGTQDRSVKLTAKIAAPINSQFWFCVKLNASGTFQIFVNGISNGDVITAYAPDGTQIMAATTDAFSSSFSIPKNSTNDIANNAVISMVMKNTVARAASNYFNYTFVQIPQITDYTQVQTFTPGANETFSWTSTGFTCVISRPITIGTAISLVNYTNSPAPTTWTVTSSNTGIFANSSGATASAVVGSPGNVVVNPLVTSATAITPVTITLVMTSLGARTLINPAPYTPTGIFWTAYPTPLPALTQDASIEKHCGKRAATTENKEDWTATKKVCRNTKTPASPFTIVPQVYS